MSLVFDPLRLAMHTGNVPLENHYSVNEAAEILGVSTDAIYTAIKKKHLTARRYDGRWFIHKDELSRYRREKRRPGRPRQKRTYTHKGSN